MAPSRPSDRQARAERDRLRQYQARQAVHERGVKRRTRDNVIGAIVAIVVIAGAVGAQLAYFGAGPGKPVASTSKATPGATGSATPSTTPSATPSPTATDQNQGDVPPASGAEDRTWTGTMTIDGVALGISLDGKQAPQAVASFVSLVKKKFYDGLTCHRLTSGGLSVLQCGDPKGDGTGGPGYSFGPIENAPADGVYKRGVIAMANSGSAYSNGSQFFLVYKDSTLSPDYTVMGEITSGLPDLETAVIDKGVSSISSNSNDGAPAVKTTIDSVTVR